MCYIQITMQVGKNELKWLINAGADENIADSPVNRFDMEQPQPTSQVQTPQTKPQTPIQKTQQKPVEEKTPSQDIGNKQAVEEAKKISVKCNSIDELSTAINDFNHCNLKSSAKNTVYYRGVQPCDILCIGSAPSKQDDNDGVPFSGDSEILTNRMFKAIDFDLEKIAFTNSIFWYPPGERSITAQEFEIGKPFLIKTIKLAKPKLVIVFGNELAKSLFNETASKLRGKAHDFENTKVFVLHSPKQMYNVPAYKKQIWSDLKKIKEFIKNA